MESTTAGLPKEQRAAAQEWIGVAREQADTLDLLRRHLVTPDIPAPHVGELQPFLPRGMTPYGPETR